jgi:hypothetical protein
MLTLTDEKEELQSALANLRIKSRTFETKLTLQRRSLTAQAERERLLTEKNDVSAALHTKLKTELELPKTKRELPMMKVTAATLLVSPKVR